jgi:hypothetical protein
MLGTSQVLAKVNDAFTPKQLPIEYRRYADQATICHGKIVGDCLRGDLSSNREVLVLGDSHGAMLNSFFGSLGRELNFKARVITASSCVNIPGFDYQRIAEWAQKACLGQIEAGSQYLDDAKIIVLAGMWSYQIQSAEFNSALENFLYSQHEKRVIILSQVPSFNRDVTRIQRFKLIGLSSHLERDSSYKAANKILKKIAVNHPRVEFWILDTLPVFEDAPFHEGKLIYSDRHHINSVGADAYATSAKLLFTELNAKN